MMKKTMLFLLLVCCKGIMMTAQLPRPAAPPSEPTRVNSVFLGVTGGLSIPFSLLAETRAIGGFGQAEVFVFVTKNITLGADCAYHYFPGKRKDSLNFVNIAILEVLINGSFYLNHPLNPHITAAIGYYGEPNVSHLGLVPGVGIMPKITNKIYFTVRASANFFDMNGHFFKVGAGLTFKVFQHKPIKK